MQDMHLGTLLAPEPKEQVSACQSRAGRALRRLHLIPWAPCGRCLRAMRAYGLRHLRLHRSSTERKSLQRKTEAHDFDLATGTAVPVHPKHVAGTVDDLLILSTHIYADTNTPTGQENCTAFTRSDAQSFQVPQPPQEDDEKDVKHSIKAEV